MIKIVDGDILNATEDIICHQVNCKGVMGSGIAKQIKIKYPEAYQSYEMFCKKSTKLLGNVCPVVCNDGKIIAHLFGQYNYGRNTKHTNYEALEESLQNILFLAKPFKKSIALPYNLGCGLGGGDWSIVYKIIEQVFDDYDVAIYKLG